MIQIKNQSFGLLLSVLANLEVTILHCTANFASKTWHKWLRDRWGECRVVHLRKTASRALIYSAARAAKDNVPAGRHGTRALVWRLDILLE